MIIQEKFEVVVSECLESNYLRLSNLHLGLIINFHVKYLKDGVKRLVNNLSETK